MPKVNGCEYLLGRASLPKGITACVQNAGEVVYFPSGWYHTTCALEPWSVGVGGQGGNPAVYQQDFDVLDRGATDSIAEQTKKMVECGVLEESDLPNNATSNTAVSNINQHTNDEKNWTWYNGNLNEYYNKLEQDEHGKRNPNLITSYAVHRWMGPDHSTLVHYELVRNAIYSLVIDQSSKSQMRVFDAGCGLGAGLMWFEQHEPTWSLVGHTISEYQYMWIVHDLPKHKFVARLRSYDEPLFDTALKYNAVYSIEAAIHSPNLKESIHAWSNALEPGGVIIIIDDFLSVGVPSDDPDIDLFARSWIANAVHTTTEIAHWADKMDMTLVRDRDLGSEYQIIKRNYRNRAPKLRDEHGRIHQGWLGSKVRQKLMVEGKISYRMIVLQKKGGRKNEQTQKTLQQESCVSVPTSDSKDATLAITIDPVLMTGKGKRGGKQMACISGWYCCNKGGLMWDDLEHSRTDSTPYLKLDKELFGHYLTSFAKHLTDFYQTFPANYPKTNQGIFLDIGGTGSVASGMQQVISKFSNFAGPLKYWVLDSDPNARNLTNALVCDIDDCPVAPDCAYDVTFSHTVLEHAARPWHAFDTIARITKRGGLTLHLVPWSYQYHATPDDNYRFSHKALTTLLQDRNFEILDVGYDICTQPEHMKKRKDEHFETIWLTYVVGRKL